ncbi:MAG: DUF3048 domain-containing protein [Candidatus Buchananbacteria bacterium]|nr:DUF3048 domain-containing protein [Candidatus Buchananbacteria bacterium]
MKKLVKIQIAMAVSLLLAGGFFAFFIYHQLYNNLDDTSSVGGKEAGEIFYSKLDGMEVSKENQDVAPVGVMVENHVESRPQSGLSKAKIVYEFLAEADITRFLAVYDLSENLERIGPVRSARPYFIDIAREYRAIYAHSGGSPKALDILRDDDLVYNLDEFFGYNSGYFWRDDKRYAPHNLYTSSELLLKAKEHYDVLNYADLVSWKFKDGKSAAASNLEIKINYSDSPSYQVIWKYSSDSNMYERWQNNNRHVDDDGSIIEADNVIIQYAETEVLDEIGRKDIELIGEDKAVVFRDGLAILGRWQKKDTASRTVFYDENNNEIELNRGKTWVEVAPADLDVSY